MDGCSSSSYSFTPKESKHFKLFVFTFFSFFVSLLLDLSEPLNHVYKSPLRSACTHTKLRSKKEVSDENLPPQSQPGEGAAAEVDLPPMSGRSLLSYPSNRPLRM